MELVETLENQELKKRNKTFKSMINELKKATFLIFEENEIFTKLIRFYVYTTIILISVAAIFTFIGIVPSHTESALYLISTLIQSEAAILAIVITLSLVAVQETASRYSPRVTDIFKNITRNPYFWTLISIYLGSMIYGLFTLKQIQSPSLHQPYSFDNYPYNSYLSAFFNTLLNIQTSIWLTYILGTVALILLIPYTISILRLLNPSKMIEMLSKDITTEKLEKAASSGGNKVEDDKDPIHPIVDIINSSLVNYDLQTAIKGLEIIENWIENIDEKSFEELDFKKIFENMIEYFTVMGRLAIKKDNERFVFELFPSLCKIGEISIKRKMEYVTIKVIDCFNQLGQTSVEHKMTHVALKTIESLCDLRNKAFIEKKDIEIQSIIESEKIKFIIPKILETVLDIGALAKEQKMEIVRIEAEYLENECKRELKIINNNDYKENIQIFLRWILKANETYESNGFEAVKNREFGEINDYNRALNYIDKALDINSNNTDALIFKIKVLLKQKRIEEALRLLESNILKVEENNVVALTLLGDIYCGKTDDKELDSEEAYLDVEKVFSEDWNRLLDGEKALNAYNKALEKKSNDYVILRKKNSLLCDIQKYENTRKTSEMTLIKKDDLVSSTK